MLSFLGLNRTIKRISFAFRFQNLCTSSAESFSSYDRSNITGLDYAVNRHYDSGQSRFTQVDPIGMASTNLANPQSLNLFAYVENDPTNFVDPSGLNAEEPIRIYTREPYPDSFLRFWFFVMFSSGGGSTGGGIQVGGGGGGGEPPNVINDKTPCANMAARAQKIAGEVVRSTIRNNPASTPTYITALPHFDFNFNTLYIGHRVDGSIASIDYFSKNGGDNTSSAEERGQQDFKDQFIDADFPRFDLRNGAERDIFV